MRGERLGVIYGAAAYFLWGLLPLYWPLLEPAGAGEILAHRILWSLAIVAGILLVRRRWQWVRNLERQQALILIGAAGVVSVNWYTYIWAVNAGHVVETSLGYFINPLVTIAFGVVLLRERLRPTQWTAVALACLAVAVLTADYGRLPWIALTLAVNFAVYGLLKKKAGVGAAEGLTVESLVLTLPALGFLLLLTGRSDATFATTGTVHALLLASTGLATAIPLLCFGAAAIRVPLTTMGLLQYLAPVLQFLIGVLVYREPMPASRVAGFALVWLALVILTADTLHHHRRSLREVRAAPASASA